MTLLRTKTHAALLAFASVLLSSLASAAEAPAMAPTAAPVEAPAPAVPDLAPSAPPAATPPIAPEKVDLDSSAGAPISAFGRPSQRVGIPPSATRPVPTVQAEERVDDGLMGSHQSHFYGMLGYRATRVTSDGYQPFASDQALHQVSILLGRVLFADQALSFALGAGWDYGASSADARGASTTLDVHRLTLVPEIRYHLFRRLYAFGRLGAGVSLVHAELADPVTERQRVSDRVAFSVDPSLGLACEVIGEPAGSSRQPRVWLLLDGGYLFTTATRTVLANEGGVPARTEDHSFGELALSGLTGRVSAALTF